jgi:hypothetical protein
MTQVHVLLFCIGTVLLTYGTFYIENKVTFNLIEKTFKPGTGQYRPMNKTCPIMVDLTTNSYFPSTLETGKLNTQCEALCNCLEYQKHGIKPSRMFIYYNASFRTTIPELCDSVVNFKTCEETYYPYTGNAVNNSPSQDAYTNAANYPACSYMVIPQTLQAIRELLYSNQTFICGINMYSSFRSDLNGIIPMPTFQDRFEGAQTFHVCGYDDITNLVTVQGSFGTHRGNNGFFYLPYAYILNKNLAFNFVRLKIYIV